MQPQQSRTFQKAIFSKVCSISGGPRQQLFLLHTTDELTALQFDAIAESRNRKLVAMAIAGLVSTGRSEVLNRLSTEIMNLWLDVFGEMKEALQPENDECVSKWRAQWSIMVQVTSDSFLAKRGSGIALASRRA